MLRAHARACVRAFVCVIVRARAERFSKNPCSCLYVVEAGSFFIFFSFFEFGSRVTAAAAVAAILLVVFSAGVNYRCCHAFLRRLLGVRIIIGVGVPTTVSRKEPPPRVPRQ